MRVFVILCAIFMLARPHAAPAQSSEFQPIAMVDREWGVLADLAGRGFEYRYMLVTFRWVQPRSALEVKFWSKLGNSSQVIKRDPATGELRWDGRGHGTVGADGTLLADGQPLYSRDPDGAYLFSGKKRLRPIIPGSWQDGRLRKLIAEGHMPSQPSGQAIAQLPHPGTASSALTAPALQRFEQTSAPSSVPATLSNAAANGPRLALIIGNSAYAASMGQLPNPANDAAAIAQALGALGFQVTLVKNADQKGMRRAISDFGQRLAKAGPGSTGLFFYAGHGIQAKGVNYLIPTDANIQTQADVEMEAVGADAVLEQMEEARASTNIVILDACRNMPLVRGFRSPTRGLAPMDAPNGSFIAYSTAPGSVAADGIGANSPFVTALVKNMGRKGESIESIFRNVRREVRSSTEGTQTPWDSSSLVEPFYFAGQ